MPSTARPREPKASRARVWQAVEKIVHAGRRPTVEGVREVLGGGSPNSVTAYINEWYQELSERLALGDPALPGVPREAIALLVDLWRVASGARGGAPAAPDGMLEAERTAFTAEIKALETLNKELDRQRAAAEKGLAEMRALYLRGEAAREALRARASELETELAQASIELQVALERARVSATQPRRRSPRGAKSPKLRPAARTRRPAKVSRAKKPPRRGPVRPAKRSRRPRR